MEFVSSFLIVFLFFQATKRHLTQRIENLDGKMDQQVELSKLIKNEVHLELGYILCDL